MKLLVTGAGGFIGRHLVSHLSHSHEVFALVRDRDTHFPGEKVSIIATDLRDPLDPNQLPSTVDVIIHLAQANVPLPKGVNEILAVNTGSTKHLLDYGRKARAKRFILASSGDVYGERLGPSKETDPANATSLYAVSKRAAEMLTQAYSDDMQICILRLFHPYGPQQSGRLIPRFADAIQKREPIKLNRGGRPHLTPIHIDDVLRTFAQAIQSSYSGILNVAGDRAVSVRELAEEIGRVVEAKPLFQTSDDDASDLMGDNTLMKQVFGAWPMVTLTDGLLRTFKRQEVSGCQVSV